MRSCLAALLVATITSTPALADTSAAVLGLESQDAPADVVQEMTLALRLALADAPGYQAVPGKDLVEMRLIFCADAEEPACMAKAAKSLGADQLIYGIVATSRKSHTVSMNLLDGATGTVKVTAEEVLPLAVAPLDIETAATRLLGRLIGLPVPSLLRVVCEPAGARLAIDDVDIGHVGESGRTVPDVNPGPRKIRLSLTGYVPYEKTVEIRSGEANELRVQLSPEGQVEITETAPPPPPPPGTGRTWRIVSWVSLGVAVATGTAAIVTGLKTRSIEDEKRDAILAWNEDHPAPQLARIAAGPSGDACSEAKSEGAASDVIDACDRGSRMALITNVLLSTAGAAALLWGVSFHQGYLSVDPTPSGAVVVANTSF